MVEMIRKYNKIIIVLLVVVSGFIYISWGNSNDLEESIGLSDEIGEDFIKEVDKKEELEDNESSEEIQKVPVHICGEVINPDVYYLYETDILKDGILMAGGFTDEADLGSLNLARNIEKGMKIYVPKFGEEIDKTDILYNNSIQEVDKQNASGNLIDINSASINELTGLPGIGPKIGENIINYREENGGFNSLEEIKNVSRIGDITFDNIKEYIYCQ